MEKVVKVVFLVFLISSCQSTKDLNRNNDFLFEVGETPVSSEEFLYVYSKNNFNKDSTFNRKDVEEYLELFINFKLKVKEAKALGLDQKDAFKGELEGYRKQLAKPYLTESKVTDQLVEEAYDRMKYEVDASHILLRLNASAEPEDTLNVYNRILEIKDRIEQGDSFSDVAREVSEDPSAKTNGGKLGYFSAFQMVYPFESAAYKTEAGNLSDPVRTRFGYHILYVHDKRPSKGKVKVSHIMIRSNEGMPPDVKESNKKKIDEIYSRLVASEDWNTLCSQFSEDLASSKKGGQLPWIGTGNVDPAFEAAAFGLQRPGDISKPVLSPYGWHIIKLNDKKNLASFEEMAAQLKAKIESDSRSELSKKILINRLKKENEYVLNKAHLNQVIALADSSLLAGKWQVNQNDSLSAQPLFSVKEQTIKVDSFFHFLEEKQRPRSAISPKALMKDYFNDFEEETLLAFEEAHLVDKYEDYRMLLKEYHEGILLFEIMDQRVWSKAMKDSLGLVDFFDKNQKKYYWQERAEAIIVNAANKEVLDDIKALKINSKFAIKTISLNNNTIHGQAQFPSVDQLVEDLMGGEGEEILIETATSNELALKRIKEYMVEKGVGEDLITSKEYPKDDEQVIRLLASEAKPLEKQYNLKDALAVQISEGIFEKNENEVLDELTWEKGGSSVIVADNRYYWVFIKDVLPPTPKKLEDIKGTVISDYQNHLEHKWIDELKIKYPVKVNKIAFEKVIKKLGEV